MNKGGSTISKEYPNREQLPKEKYITESKTNLNDHNHLNGLTKQQNKDLGKKIEAETNEKAAKPPTFDDAVPLAAHLDPDATDVSYYGDEEKPKGFNANNSKYPTHNIDSERISTNYGHFLDGDIVNAYPEMAKYTKFITANNLAYLLHDPIFSKNVGIIDLRSARDGAREKGAEKKISGAEEFPLRVKSEDIGSLGEGPFAKKASWERARNWKQELENEDSAFYKVQDKSVVIFYCQDSSEKALKIANGYSRYAIGQSKGQRIFILKGGFQEWLKNM